MSTEITKPTQGFATKFIPVATDFISPFRIAGHFYLDLETHIGESILLVSIPDCEGCHKMMHLLHQVQQELKSNNKSPLFVYSLILDSSDKTSGIFQRRMNLSIFPSVFHVNKKGKLTLWSEKFPAREISAESLKTIADK